MTKRIIVYGVGTFFSKGLVFLMVPIYARVFSKGDFGYYDVLVSNMQMIVSIAFIEVWSGIIRFMFESDDRYEPVKTTLRMMPVLLVLYALAVFILSFFFELKYPLHTVIYGILYYVFSVSNSICRGLEQNTKYVISGLISTVVSCTLSIVFAVFMHLGIEFLLIAQSAGYLFAIIYVELTTRAYQRAFRSKYKTGSLREMIIFCVPLMLNSFSFLFLGTYNKNIIINQLGESQSGIYAFIGKFSAIISVLLSVYSLAWQEEAFVNAGAKDRDSQYSHYLNEFIKLVGVGIPLFIMMCILFSPWFGGSEYFNSEVFIPLAVLAGYISILSGVISTVIAVGKKTNLILYSTIAGALVNVLIASLTIRRYGINASSISLCMGFGVSSLLRYFFAKKGFDLKIQWGYLALMILETAAIVVLLYAVGSRLVLNIGITLVTMVLWLVINRGFIKTAWIKAASLLNRGK